MDCFPRHHLWTHPLGESLRFEHQMPAPPHRHSKPNPPHPPVRTIAAPLAPPTRPRARVVAAADVDPDNASILVCGGGGVALHVTRKLKDMGSWVWMLQRKEDRRKEIEGMMAIVAKGDALSKEDVEKVFAGELACRRAAARC